MRILVAGLKNLNWQECEQFMSPEVVARMVDVVTAAHALVDAEAPEHVEQGPWVELDAALTHFDFGAAT